MNAAPEPRSVSSGIAAPASRAEVVSAIGIDVGSSNTKIVLLQVMPDGRTAQLACSRWSTPNTADALLATVRSEIRTVLTDVSASPLAIGIASMAETGVPLNADREPLAPLIRWNRDADRRDAEALISRLGARELARATGVPVTPKAPLAVWERMRRSQPDLLAAMSFWAGAADLICLGLAGELVTDHTLAARTMAYRLPEFGAPLPTAFDPQLLAEVGFDARRLARVASPGEPAGGVLAAVARETGLAGGTPLFIAGHDHAVAAWAAGARSGGAIADSIGTAEALVRTVDDPVDREMACASGMTVSRGVTGGLETLTAGMAGGGFIAWCCEHLAAGADPAELFAGVDASHTDPADLLVLPYPTGRQAPAPDPEARIRIEDETGAEIDATALLASDRGRRRLGRAILEGLSLQLRWMDAEQSRIIGGRAAHPFTVVGGAAAANSAWLDIKSAVLCRQLSAVTEGEPVAAGAALLALVRAGAVSGDVSLPATAEAIPAPGDPYASAFSSFVSRARDQPLPKGTR